LLLNHPNITDKQKEQVTEILNDEKDHLVIFSEMIPKQVKNEFPNSGEK
jgi:rubrerythrin